MEGYAAASGKVRLGLKAETLDSFCQRLHGAEGIKL